MKRILLLIMVCVFAFGGLAEAAQPDETPTIYLYLDLGSIDGNEDTEYDVEWLDQYLFWVQAQLVLANERPRLIADNPEALGEPLSSMVGDLNDYPDVFAEPPYRALLIRVQLWTDFETLSISPFVPFPYDPLPIGEFGWISTVNVNDNEYPSFAIDMAVGTALYITGSCEAALENFQSIRETADYRDTDLFTYSAPRFYEANCRYSLGEVEAAAKLFEEILAHDTSDGEPQTIIDELWVTDLPAVNLAAIYIEMGRSDEALALLDTYRNLSTENRSITEREFERYFARADLYLALDEPERAIAEFDELLGILDEDDTLNPLVIFAWIYTERGYRHEQIGDTSAALADYEQAIELDPEYPVAYYRRALLESGEEAQADLEMFLELALDFRLLHHPSLDAMIEDAESRLE